MRLQAPQELLPVEYIAAESQAPQKRNKACSVMVVLGNPPPRVTQPLLRVIDGWLRGQLADVVEPRFQLLRSMGIPQREGTLGG